MQKTRFSQKLSNLELWCLLTTYRKSYRSFSKKNWRFGRNVATMRMKHKFTIDHWWKVFVAFFVWHYRQWPLNGGGSPSQRAAITKVRHRKGPPLRPGRPIQARVRVRDLCDGGPLRWRTAILWMTFADHFSTSGFLRTPKMDKYVWRARY